MSCRGFHFCGFCDDCPFDDQCGDNDPNAHGYINGVLATATPHDPVEVFENEGGKAA